MHRRNRRPNILLIVSDQERQRDWLPTDVRLPWRDRLMAEGLELTRAFCHSSPCSPSRASLMTGQYVPQHGVPDNVIMPDHAELSTSIPTLGRMLREVGYRSSYIGKWHLSQGPKPDMEAYGYSDWDGDDRHFMGLAGTGVHFDPIIADNAAHWLRKNSGSLQQPWFLTVALVNPHDVMWYPIDQPFYARAHPEEHERVRSILQLAAWKEDDPLPLYDRDYPRVFERLPANFRDDLSTKPAAQRAWRHDQQHSLYGYIDPEDEQSWLRQLDYYVDLHRRGDDNLGRVLSALDESGEADDTIVIFTSDHGDMCGSHGLRSKGPFVYDEVMRVPLYVKAPGITTPGTRSEALATHVDLAATITSLAGVAEQPSVFGRDLSPVLADPDADVREDVLFVMDSAHTAGVLQTRYAIRGFFDGRYKYARHYGIGGGLPASGLGGADPGPKAVEADAPFDEQEHELYDLQEDPHELVNLAADPAKRDFVRECFDRLLAIEARELG